MIINPYAFAAGGVTPLVPSDVAGLQTWWKADAITGLVNNDPVTVWPDSSGNSRPLLQEQGFRQGQYKTGGPNGLPYVHFNPSNNNALECAFTLSQPNTIFFVGSNSGRNFDSQGRQLMIFGPGGGAMYAGGFIGGTTPYSALGYHIACCLFNGPSSQLIIDGALEASGDPGAGGITKMFVGTDGFANYFDMDVGEIATFTGILSPGDIAGLFAGFADKWQ